MAFADVNFMQMSYIPEVTWGVTPGSGNDQILRITGQSLDFGIRTLRTNEIRSDRMTSDLAVVDAEPSGGFDTELSYGNADDFVAAALFSAWFNTPNKAGSTECGSVTGTNTFGVNAGGTAFKAGHLIKTTGYTSSANNLVTPVVSSTGTTVVTGATLVNESSVSTCRIKVVGFQGASGDITATTSGGNALLSTALDFTTLGIVAGMWLKVGGSGAAFKFANIAANNDWVRVSAITATRISLDIVPSGWATDNGASKTIQVWMGDYVKSGTTKTSFSIQRYHTDITQYFIFRGMYVNNMRLTMQTGQILTAQFDFMGKDSARAGSTYMPGSPVAATTGNVLNAVNNVVKLIEGGSNAGFVQQMGQTVGNNLRPQKAISVLGNAGVGAGDIDSAGTMAAYFENGNIIDKFYGSIDTSLAFVSAVNAQAYTFDLPRVKLEQGRIVAGQRNSDAVIQVGVRGLRHTALNTQNMINRFYYYE